MSEKDDYDKQMEYLSELFEPIKARLNMVRRLREADEDVAFRKFMDRVLTPIL